MAKKSSIENNKRRERLVKKYKARRQELKSQVMNRSISVEERFQLTLKFATLPRNSAAVRVRNRCELTGRARSVYRKFKLSRIALRELASMGLIPGMTKSSW